MSERERINQKEKTLLKRVFSMDIGRKYFSLKQVKEVIDQLKQHHYTDLHLLLGNDGMRFLLDDLSIRTPYGNYTSAAVKEAIKIGNRLFWQNSTEDCWTEREMDELVDYAVHQNIEIIPALDTPGHMDALLLAMNHLGILQANHVYQAKQSSSTMELENEEALSFIKALIEKYIAYFATKGAAIFNLGADEYANDLYEQAQGFSMLQKLGKYQHFVRYVNDLASLVKSFGLRPMVFNDGIYYSQEDTNYFDSDLLIAYWTSGWDRYTVSSADYLAQKGHQLLNTNDAWYYVIGRETEDSGWYHWQQGMTGIRTVAFDQVAGASQPVSIIGSMLATWIEHPSFDYQQEKVSALFETFARCNASYFKIYP